MAVEQSILKYLIISFFIQIYSFILGSNYNIITKLKDFTYNILIIYGRK